MRGCVHHLYCMDTEKVESDNHLAVAYQKVGRLLQKYCKLCKPWLQVLIMAIK